MQTNLAEANRRIEEARRTQAESLDLGDLALSELPASLGGLPYLKALYLGTFKPDEAGNLFRDRSRKSPGFKDLIPLAGLQALQNLDLSYCTGVTDLGPLAGIQVLQNLDLRSCTGVTDLGPLAGLQALQNLYLSECTGVTDLGPLAELQALQNLDLSDCRGVTDLGPLAGLQALQNLDLSDCRGVTDLGPLAGLQALQNLYLSECTGVTDLGPLAGLQALQNLYLRSCTDVTDLGPLAGLQALQNLDLSDCTGVTDLGPLAELQALQNLDLPDCTGVTNLGPLAGIQALQNLDLYSCTGVTDLGPLAGLQALQNLDLSDCTGVTDLGPLAGIQALQNLYLYGCWPAIPFMLLRSFEGHLRLAELVANEAVGVPREILSHGYDDNCLPRLRAHFSELDLGAEAENEVKVILLGNGRVGKTQLCRRFRGQPFDDSVQSTHGVQIWREEWKVRTGDQEQAFQVNWWDFGGQDIYHGTHALFLRSRAVFLILWTPELENRAEYTENGIPMRNQPLAYWLDYVRSLAGEDSPVIVVQSQCDRFADRRPDPARPESFGFFECCPYSAREELGRETLESHLRNAIRYLLERNGPLEIGKGRANLRRQLYDWRRNDQERRPEKRQHRTLTSAEFQTLCDEAGDIVSWEHALDYFHHTGALFYRPDLFSNCIVLDQTWALDAVYAVFHRGRAAPWLRDSGRFTREDLAFLAWEDYSVEEQKLFLGLMKSCGVCFLCGTTSKGEPRYIAPDLLPGFEAVASRLHAWKEDPDTVTLRLEYRFFHPAVIRNLMSEIGQQAGDLAEYWKYGLWFKDGQRDTQLLVQFEDTSTDEAPGAGTLELKAQGRDPLGLLREIRKAILQERIGAKPEELLTLNGTTVARNVLDSPLDDGRVLDVKRKLVSGAEFAAFFEGRKYGLIPRSEEQPRIEISPQPLAPGEKQPEVFISYAWGDEKTPEGKIRSEVVDGLYSALEKDGFQPLRDRDQMRSGELISAFIRRLTQGDLVVAIISDKYLRSPYCMAEIHGLWQKSQEDSKLMAERLVPMILPGVELEKLRDRAIYVRHWREQKKELEKLFRDLGPDLAPESFRELRLVRSFAQDVDGILRFLQDVLMPRNLEAHLEDGFLAVRDALRRRIAGTGQDR